MEAQLVVNPKLIEFKTFETEDKAKEFVSIYEGFQLGAITHGKKIYVALPSVVSKATEEAIKKVTDKLKLNVPLGFEYAIEKTWYGCH